MDSSISVRVFEWRGELHCVIDRIGATSGRRHAPRARVASFHGEALPALLPAEAMEWAIHQLTLWMNAGFAPDGGVAVSAPLEGPQGGSPRSGAPTGQERAGRLPSQAVSPSVEGCGAVGVSDGLSPAGEQLVIPVAVDYAQAPIWREHTHSGGPQQVGP
jgi:hypothetical protein